MTDDPITRVEKIIYKNLPKEGVALDKVPYLGGGITFDAGKPPPTNEQLLKNLENQLVKAGIPKNEIEAIKSDKVLTRGELLGVIAGIGNNATSLSKVKVSATDIEAMTKAMEKWGLDPAKPAEKQMIVGLAKVEKQLGNFETKLRKAFDGNKDPGLKSDSPTNSTVAFGSARAALEYLKDVRNEKVLNTNAVDAALDRVGVALDASKSEIKWAKEEYRKNGLDSVFKMIDLKKAETKVDEYDRKNPMKMPDLKEKGVPIETPVLKPSTLG
jgi:hypothetical protein